MDERQQVETIDTIARNFLRDPDNRMYGSLEKYQDHWPIRHVHAGLPPFLFLIAESEQDQPPVLKTNTKFVEDARKFGDEADYKVFAGRNTLWSDNFTSRATQCLPSFWISLFVTRGRRSLKALPTIDPPRPPGWRHASSLSQRTMLLQRSIDRRLVPIYEQMIPMSRGLRLK